MCGVDRVERLQRVAVHDVDVERANPARERRDRRLVVDVGRHARERVGRDVDRDAFALVGGAQRAVHRRVHDRLDDAAALQFGGHLELAVRRTLPVEVERAHERTDRSRRSCHERAPRQDREPLVGERKVRVVIALPSRAPLRAIRGGLARVVGEPARTALVVQQRRVGSVDAAQAGGLESEAVVDVVVRDGEAFAVEPAVFEEDAAAASACTRRSRRRSCAQRRDTRDSRAPSPPQA